MVDGLRRGKWVPRGWGTLEKQSNDGEVPRRTATAPTPGGRKVKGRRGQEQSLADAIADLPAEGAQRGRAHLADGSVPVSLRLHRGKPVVKGTEAERGRGQMGNLQSLSGAPHSS